MSTPTIKSHWSIASFFEQTRDKETGEVRLSLETQKEIIALCEKTKQKSSINTLVKKI